MPPLHVLIKPASSLCNLRCDYCFYADETSHRQVACYGRMSDETLSCVIEKALAQADGTCTFGFQGGEPTLMGLPFFRRVVELERTLNHKGVTVQNALQTNGILIDDEWAAFLAEHHFLVGLSLDGFETLHDRHRVDAQAQGTHAQVMRTAELFKAHGVEFNILTVVTAQMAQSVEKMYRFFRRNGLLYQQYIPCLPPLYAPREVQADALTPALYERFLKILFDLWFEDIRAGRFIYIRYFENLVGMLRGAPPETCGMMGRCAMQHVIEADGGVYPCDFYVLDAYRVGNICTDDFVTLSARLKETRFIEASHVVDARCKKCEWYGICRGGCRRDREDAGGALGLNYFCEAYRGFFAYAMPRLSWLSQRV